MIEYFPSFNIAPNPFASLVQIYLIWGFQFNLSSIITPRKFVSLTSMVRFFLLVDHPQLVGTPFCEEHEMCLVNIQR